MTGQLLRSARMGSGQRRDCILIDTNVMDDVEFVPIIVQLSKSELVDCSTVRHEARKYSSAARPS